MLLGFLFGRLLLCVLLSLLLRVFGGLLVGVVGQAAALSLAQAPSAVGAADLAVVFSGRELLRLGALQGLSHELLEQVGGVSSGRDAVSGEGWHHLRIALIVRIPDSPHIHHAGGVPHERRSHFVVGGTGLAGDGPAQHAGCAGRRTVRGGALHGLLYQSAVVGIEHLGAVAGRIVHVLIVGIKHFGHHVQGVLHAIVGDGRMALRQIPHGQGVDAQHVVHGVFIDIALNARFMGDCGRALRRQMLIDVHEHRVHRVGGGLIQIDVAPVVLQSVVHLLIQAGEVLVGIAVEQRIEADAGLRGPQQSERLHSRTRFEYGLIGIVELLGQII